MLQSYYVAAKKTGHDLSLISCIKGFIYFILFATLITKNIGKEEEKKKRSGEET